MIAISDKGPGISPERIPFLFEPFQAGPNSTGLGLGLHLAHRIAEAHGGDLTLDPAYRQGACFLFSLPVSVDVMDETEKAPSLFLKRVSMNIDELEE